MNPIFYYCPDFSTFQTLKLSNDPTDSEYITYTGNIANIGIPDVKWNQICFVFDNNNPIIYTRGKIFYSSNEIKSIINNKTTLSSNYELSSYSNSYLSLKVGDTYDKAFGKLEKAIIDNEFTISNALINLDNRITIADWNENNSSSYSYIQNKPDLSNFLTSQIQSDWNEDDNTSAAYILNKPSIPTDYVVDYSKQYLTCVALEDGTISFNIWKDMGTEYITSISYSTDNGETWTTTNNTNNKEEHLTISVNVNEGDKVLWKGNAQQTGYNDEDHGDYFGSFFSSDCEFDVQGNVMSLLYGDDFQGENTLEYECQFAYLFYDYDEENECNIVNARNLSLPATILSNACYFFMFQGCTSLTTAPELTATTLANECYDGMFQNCTSLTTVPELPATILTADCYYDMFSGCTNLNYIKCLATDISASDCTNTWVNNVAPTGIFIKAASMDDWNEGDNDIPINWSIITWEEYNELNTPLPLIIEVEEGDTDVPTGTYYKISVALILRKDVIVKYRSNNYTYYAHIVDEPDVYNGDNAYWFHCNESTYYYYMSINYGDTFELIEEDIFALESHDHGNIQRSGTLQTNDVTIANGDKLIVTDASDSNKIARTSLAFDGSTTTQALTKKGTWETFLQSHQDISGKANLASPVFTGTPAAPTANAGTNTTQIATTAFVQGELDNYKLEKDYSKEYLTFVALESGVISFTILDWIGTDCIESIAYSKNNNEWVVTQNSNDKENDILINISVVEGDTIRWKGIANHYGDDEYEGGVFTSTCEFNVEGNIMSLLYGDNFVGQTTLEYDYTFSYLFFDDYYEDSTLITDASNLVLPATTLTASCYYYMFYGCTSLITAPEIVSATTLADYCCYNMFCDCTSLINAPKIVSATTLADSCYGQMFYGCTSLTIAPKLPATTLANNCYKNMFTDCTSLTTAPELPATTLAERCYREMFYGCTSLISASKLPATTLAEYCYEEMFRDCTSLTTVPELAATILANGCYYCMFDGCTSLNYIKCLATNIPSSSCTSSWVNDVAATGTFIKADSMSSWTIDEDGIPSGWTVYTESEYSEVRHYELPAAQIQADWNQTATGAKDYIKNKPDLSNFLTIETQSNWNETNTSSAAYIQNKPTIPAAQIQADWNQTITTALDYVKNKPNIYNNLGLYIRDNDSIEILTTHQSIIFDDSGGESISIIGDEAINLDADKVYYNSYEVATKNDIPTVPTTSTTVTQNDTNPVSGGAVYNKFADLIGTAPAALDTLGEIAYALNNDADLAATLTNQITSKVPKVSNPTADNFASFNSDGTIKDSSYSASSFIRSIKTVNNESLVGTGNIVVSGLPQVSASDNGKILMVVNGQWQLVSPSVLYSGSGIPNNANGNNGDLFIQTE